VNDAQKDALGSSAGTITRVTPPLTDTQRSVGYQRSLELRRLRQTVKTAITLRRLTIPDVLEWAEVRGMRVSALLTAIPTVGSRRAASILEKAGIPPRSTVQALGPNQTERLLKAVEKYS
jgi:hypothetical protein